MTHKKNKLGDYISGRVLANKGFQRRLPLIFYASLLVFAYMTYNFTIQGKFDDMNKLKNEIRALQTVYITTNVQRSEMTQREQIERLMKEYGIELKQGEEQPRIIE